MKKIIGLSFILFAGITLFGCSGIIEDSLDSNDAAYVEIATKQETGNGSIELLTPTITTNDYELEFKTAGIDENKTTFIFVAPRLLHSIKHLIFLTTTSLIVLQIQCPFVMMFRM